MLRNSRLQAAEVDVAPDAEIGPGSVVRADRAVLASGVRIGSGVQITCDVLELGEGCTIGDGTHILAPRVELAEGCALGEGLTAQLNEVLQLGPRSVIGRRARITGQGLQAAEYLWVKDDVIVGGGGALGPRSYLRVGARSSIFDRAFINISETVDIGSDTALSFNVAVLTHGAWQPALQGFATAFAPVSIGDHSVIYVNSVVLPGATIGSYTTVAAGSVVREDVPDHCLAAGNPARVRRGPGGYPTGPDTAALAQLVLGVLERWADTLPVKGVDLVENQLAAIGRLVAAHEGRTETVAFGTAEDADITLGFGPPTGSGCHFDLETHTVAGEPSPLAEDLRDFLRRNAIRLFTDKPFRALPPTNLARLRARQAGNPGCSGTT